MTQPDEPLFDSDAPESHRRASSPSIRNQVHRLVHEQPYAVLCTQGKHQPYGALIAVAFTEDLQHAVFATPVTTRKYRLLSDCDHGALVIDNRSNRTTDVMEIEAVTATGRAHLVERSRNNEQDGDFERWSDVLVARHPYLKSFVKAASCALFRFDVIRYFHVVRFQEVYQWSPRETS